MSFYEGMRKKMTEVGTHDDPVRVENEGNPHSRPRIRPIFRPEFL